MQQQQLAFAPLGLAVEPRLRCAAGPHWFMSPAPPPSCGQSCGQTLAHHTTSIRLTLRCYILPMRTHPRIAPPVLHLRTVFSSFISPSTTSHAVTLSGKRSRGCSCPI